jgi:hypothetical protein
MKTIKELLESLKPGHNSRVLSRNIEKMMAPVRKDDLSNLDTIDLHSHKTGTDMGKYGTFNVEKTTPTMIHAYDHNTGKIIKINKKSGRGIGEHSDLMLKESVGSIEDMSNSRLKYHAVKPSLNEISDKTMKSYLSKSYVQSNKMLKADSSYVPKSVKDSIAAGLKKRKFGIVTAGKRLGKDIAEPIWKAAQNEETNLDETTKRKMSESSTEFSRYGITDSKSYRNSLRKANDHGYKSNFELTASKHKDNSEEKTKAHLEASDAHKKASKAHLAISTADRFEANIPKLQKTAEDLTKIANSTSTKAKKLK